MRKKICKVDCIIYKKAEFFINLFFAQKGQYSVEILRWKRILDSESPENRNTFLSHLD